MSSPNQVTTVGRYELLEPLGAGGMATVHLGRCDEGRRVAIKRLHAFVAEDPANVALLRDEARLAACVRHPNVVGIVDIIEGAHLEAPALVMEWVEGVDLATLTAAASKQHQRLPLDVVVAIVRDVLEGLHAAHEATREDGFALEIVHRDVSPQNILVGVDGISRVTDFGVAKAAWRTQVTEIGMIKGKLGYMAPEQLEGRGDRRADLYGAGVVLWELLTGTRLRGTECSGAQMLVQILHGIATAPSSVQADLAFLDEIVLRALARDPESRFATTRELAERLVASVAPASAERVAEVVAELLGGPKAIIMAPVLAPVRDRGGWGVDRVPNTPAFPMQRAARALPVGARNDMLFARRRSFVPIPTLRAAPQRPAGVRARWLDAPAPTPPL